MTDRSFAVGGTEVAVEERSTRTTIEITVERDGSLFMAVPAGTPDKAIQGFIERKQEWIHRKLIEKADFLPVLPPKELVNGEGFKYLGRNYRLLLVDHQDTPVKAARGRLCLRRREPDPATAIRSWYRNTGTPWLRTRMQPWADRIGADGLELAVRSLGYRWGSQRLGRLNIHWASLQLPPSLIDYVLVHELTHFHHADHSPKFWALVERAMPDYRERRQRLAVAGANVWLGGLDRDSDRARPDPAAKNAAAE